MFRFIQPLEIMIPPPQSYHCSICDIYIYIYIYIYMKPLWALDRFDINAAPRGDEVSSQGQHFYTYTHTLQIKVQLVVDFPSSSLSNFAILFFSSFMASSNKAISPSTKPDLEY